MMDSVFPPRDPRTVEWMTISNWSFITVTIGTYLFGVMFFGPRYMKNRKPYDLSKVIMAYNIFQVATNLYVASKLFYLSFIVSGYSPFCERVHYETDPLQMEIFHLLYMYLLIRIVDFTDTLFFILRKKFAHITVLHVLHHTMIVLNGWLFFRYGAQGHPMLMTIVNAMIHVIMYSYYLLAAVGLKKYLWWKRYLTKAQILQFIVGLFHSIIPVFVDCGYPRSLILFAYPQGALLLALFINFYYQSYIRKNNAQTSTPISNCCFPELDADTDLNTKKANFSTLLSSQVKNQPTVHIKESNYVYKNQSQPVTSLIRRKVSFSTDQMHDYG